MKNSAYDYQDILTYKDHVDKKIFQNIEDGTFQKI